ncbi:MAG: ArnT family glycosyltransferase [Anaerolineae bacterium]
MRQPQTDPHRIFPALISVLFVLLATLYNITTPIFESADEVWHYPVVHHLENNRLQLPILNPQDPMPWRQQAAQPPLYYLLAAIITMPIDTSDMDTVRRLNPQELGVQYADTIPNAVVHHPTREAFPWRGTVLAVHIARGLSTMFGLATLWVTYTLARLLCPAQRWVAEGAMALNAGLPMFVLVSASVSNDALAILLGNSLLLAVIALVNDTLPATPRTYALLGLIVGAGLLSKLSLGFGILMVALALLIRDYRAYQHGQAMRHVLVGGIISSGMTILIAGWWYWHNWMTYGDPTALNVFLDVVGRHEITLRQLALDYPTLIRSTWGFVGAIYAPMPDWVYALFNAMVTLGVLGMVIDSARHRRKPSLIHTLSLLWVAIIVVGMVRWSLTTPALQGRLAFGALSPALIAVVYGLGIHLSGRVRQGILLAVSAYFIAVTSIAPFAVIIPTFSAPPELPEAMRSAEAQATFRHQEQALALLSTDIDQTTIRPGDLLEIAVSWRVETPLTTDWTLFIHAINPQGVIVAQRDLYPALNRIATSDLRTGRTWQTRIQLAIPQTIYTPAELQLVLGLYDEDSGVRMSVDEGADYHRLDTLNAPQQVNEQGIPNPIGLNFGDQITLAGYDIDQLSIEPNDTVQLTLYWQAQRPLDRDYVVFANIIDPVSLTKVADSNAMPANWTRPTSSWAVDEIIHDTHTLTVYPDAEAGIYELEIGLYVQSDDFPRLTLISADGRPQRDFAYLTRIRITLPD